MVTFETLTGIIEKHTDGNKKLCIRIESSEKNVEVRGVVTLELLKGVAIPLGTKVELRKDKHSDNGTYIVCALVPDSGAPSICQQKHIGYVHTEIACYANEE